MIEALSDPRFRRTVLPVFLGLFLAATAVQGLFLRFQAVRHAEETAETLAANLRTGIARSVGLEDLTARLEDPVRYQVFDNLVRNRLLGSDLREVRLYDADGAVLYATTPALLHRPVDHEEVEEAARGKTVAELISAGAYRRRYGQEAPGTMVEAYLPLLPDRRPSPVLEAYLDFSHAGTLAWRTFWTGALALAGVVLAALGVAAALYARLHRLEEKVEALESFLPICAKCKKIRVEEEGKPKEWVSVEQYFEERQDVAFSHGLCDECLRELYPDIADDVLEKKKVSAGGVAPPGGSSSPPPRETP